MRPQLKVHREQPQMLLKAGFKPFPVTTTQQQKQFQKLRTGKITTIKHDGKIYFLYPDLPHHRLLIGGNKQFMQYNQLLTDQLVKPSKRNSNLARAWEQSGVWDNLNGWGSVNIEDPFFQGY
ncbi:MAG: hypothetical protein K2W99_08405 [Chthoniobacterales bacterium]|nr:hypothetical protein [Chthoniobacterales bacterium]